MTDYARRQLEAVINYLKCNGPSTIARISTMVGFNAGATLYSNQTLFTKRGKGGPCDPHTWEVKMVNFYKRPSGAWHLSGPFPFEYKWNDCHCTLMKPEIPFGEFEHIGVPLAVVMKAFASFRSPTFTCDRLCFEHNCTGVHLCATCSRWLWTHLVFGKQPLEESEMPRCDVELGKPVVIGPDGLVEFAETKQAAEDRAKKLAECHQAEYAVYMPRTSFSPQKPAITTKRFKG